MKLLLDDKITRGYDLNANEACVYAAILKCTKAGRGWFANYRDLAAALPFVISASTVCRAIEKLFNLGLMERRESAWFALLQNETTLLQNETSLLQNETSLLQNETKSDSPYNPLYINDNMNEKEHATCAQACDTRENQTPFWSDIRKAFKEKGGQLSTGAVDSIERSAFAAWQLASPAKKIKLLEAVRSGAHFKARLDWLIADFPEPAPDFLRGDEDTKIVQVKYEGKFKLCTPETMRLFNLEFVRDWN